MSVQNKRILGYVRLFIEAWQKLHRSFTEASQKLHRSFREFPDHCSLKAIVYRIVFLSKLESFTGANMQRRFRRTCPVCGRPDLKNISTHLLQVHGLSSEERKPYLNQAHNPSQKLWDHLYESLIVPPLPPWAMLVVIQWVSFCLSSFSNYQHCLQGRGGAKPSTNVIKLLILWIYMQVSIYFVKDCRCRHGSPASKVLRIWPCPIWTLRSLDKSM